MRRYNPDYYSYEETTRPIRPRTPRTSKPTNSRNPYTQRIVPEAEVEPIIYTQVPCAKSPKFFYGYPTTTTDYGKNLRVNDIEEASSSNPDSCMYVPVVCVPQPVIKAEEYVPEENMKYYYGEKHRIAKRKQHIPMQQPYIGYEDQEAPSYYYYYKSNYYDQPGYYNQELVDVQPSQRSPNGYYYYNDHFGRKPSSILQVPYKNYSRKPARIYVKDPTKTDLPIKQKTANTKTRGNQVRKKMTCASQTMVTDDILERIEGKCPEKMECRSTQTTKSEEQACFITNGTQTKFGKPKTGLFSCYQKANKVNNDNYDTAILIDSSSSEDFYQVHHLEGSNHPNGPKEVIPIFPTLGNLRSANSTPENIKRNDVPPSQPSNSSPDRLQTGSHASNDQE